jgi:hypothetical protein
MNIIDEGLNPNWRLDLIVWAARNDSVTAVWIFGSRGPKSLADADSDLDVGVVLMPAIGDHHWALGNYMALGDEWQAAWAPLLGAT